MTILLYLFLGMMCSLSAQEFGVPARSTTGVGTRAFSMGNNYVALSDDASAMFWNPAGLAFTPIREFQVGLSGFSYNLETDFKEGSVSAKSNADRQRIRPNLIALLRAIPTSRGGFSIAFGFQNPYILDDMLRYDEREATGDYTRKDYYSFGQLNLWTAAFGLQVAPDFGVGGAVSLITGRNTMKFMRDHYLASGFLDAEEYFRIHQSYLGADIRLGILYAMFDRMKIGMRIELPQLIAFDEEYRVEENNPDSVFTIIDDGRLKTAPTGAVGISYRFPFMLLSGECSVRAPIPDADDESIYSFWKVRAGSGVEVPLFVKSLFLRAGYAWQEYDRYPMLIMYNDPDVDIETDFTVDVLRDEHLITAGLSYMTKHGLSFDFSYGFRFWEVESYPLGGGTVNELHTIHYFTGSFALRY